LRTIEVAKQFFGMPDSYATHLSILALPIEPAYFGLNPQKPTWLHEWKDEIPPDRDNLINFVKEILANFALEDDSLDLLALAFPIKLDDNRWIDLTVVKAIADSDPAMNIEIEERSGCLCVGTLLEKKLSYETSKAQSETRFFATTSYPFMRYGHWHSDLESRGFYVPYCNIDGKKVIGSSLDDLFYYSVDDINIGFSSFWYNDWQPIHPKGIRSLCGPFTAVEKNSYPYWLQFEKESKQFFVCNATILMSEDSYSEFESESHQFCVSFGG
jgi:hypothetical protein